MTNTEQLEGRKLCMLQIPNSHRSTLISTCTLPTPCPRVYQPRNDEWIQGAMNSANIDNTWCDVSRASVQTIHEIALCPPKRQRNFSLYWMICSQIARNGLQPSPPKTSSLALVISGILRRPRRSFSHSRAHVVHNPRDCTWGQRMAFTPVVVLYYMGQLTLGEGEYPG